MSIDVNKVINQEALDRLSASAAAQQAVGQTGDSAAGQRALPENNAQGAAPVRQGSGITETPGRANAEVGERPVEQASPQRRTETQAPSSAAQADEVRRRNMAEYVSSRRARRQSSHVPQSADGENETTDSDNAAPVLAPSVDRVQDSAQPPATPANNDAPSQSEGRKFNASEFRYHDLGPLADEVVVKPKSGKAKKTEPKRKRNEPSPVSTNESGRKETSYERIAKFIQGNPNLKSKAEVARELGISPSTVYKNWAKAMEIVGASARQTSIFDANEAAEPATAAPARDSANEEAETVSEAAPEVQTSSPQENEPASQDTVGQVDVEDVAAAIASMSVDGIFDAEENPGRAKVLVSRELGIPIRQLFSMWDEAYAMAPTISDDYRDLLTEKYNNDPMVIDMRQREADAQAVSFAERVMTGVRSMIKAAHDRRMIAGGLSVGDMEIEEFDKLKDFDRAEKLIGDLVKIRTDDATRIKDEYNRALEAWTEANPNVDRSLFPPLEEWEGFDYSCSMFLDTYYPGRGKTPDKVPGKDVKKEENKWRSVDMTQRMLTRGFLRLTSQSTRPVYDEFGRDTGMRELVWGRKAEQAVTNICNLYGWDPNTLDGVRNVHRLVMVYASIGVDTHGNLFGVDANSYKMTDSQFYAICECIEASQKKYDNPFYPPSALGFTDREHLTLGGTPIYFSGVCPTVLAEAITRNSQITPYEFQQMCLDVFSTIQYPSLIRGTVQNISVRDKTNREKLKKTLAGQRVQVLRFGEAALRMDGNDAMHSASQFHIDVKNHFNIWELRDLNADYAQYAESNSFNDDFNVELVNQEHDRRLEEARRNVMKRNGTRAIPTENVDPSTAGENGENVQKELFRDADRYTALQAGLNLMAASMRTWSIAFNVPIAASAAVEKGVGDVETLVALKAIGLMNVKRGADFSVAKALMEAMHTSEAREALESAELIREIGGVDALILFLDLHQREPLTKELAVKFLNEEVFRHADSQLTEKLRAMRGRLDDITKKFLVGDFAFKGLDGKVWLTATMTFNGLYSRGEFVSGKRSLESGVALTGAEVNDMFAATGNDISRLIPQLLSTPAGRHGLTAMRTNNIASFNPISQKVSELFNRHGLSDTYVTMFLDTFPRYGLNFVYNMIPFNRTMTYIATQAWRSASSSRTAGEYAMLAEGPFFRGLVANLIFDLTHIGRHLLCAGVICAVFAAIGFDPPDDPLDRFNFDMWKIGGKLGLGPDTDGDGIGNGVEIQYAFWLNDLTQWGLPIAYGVAVSNRMANASPEEKAAFGSDHLDVAKHVFKDCLFHQFDGNVVLDCIDSIGSWRQEVDEWEMASKDPDYEFDPDMPRGPLMTAANILVPDAKDVVKGLNKLIPLNGLIRQLSNESLIWGPDATRADAYRVYGEDGRRYRIENERNVMYRQLAYSGNVLAMFLGSVTSTGVEGANHVPALSWLNPPITSPDQMTTVWLQYWDYQISVANTMDDADAGEYLYQQYEMLAEQYGWQSVDDMEGVSFIMPDGVKDLIRSAAIARANEYEQAMYAELDEELGDVSQYDGRDEYFIRRAEIEKKWNDLSQQEWDKVTKLFSNNGIPSYIPGYEALMTGWEPKYFDANGNPIDGMEYFYQYTFGSDIGEPVVEWTEKGNHPSSFLPFTVVDYENTGFSAETPSYWYDPEKGVDISGIPNVMLETGRDKGKMSRDVIFGETLMYPYLNDLPENERQQAIDAARERGIYENRLHPDATFGRRAWREQELRYTDYFNDVDVDDESSNGGSDSSATSNDNEGTGKDEGSRVSDAQMELFEGLHKDGAITDTMYDLALALGDGGILLAIDMGMEYQENKPSDGTLNYFDILYNSGYITDEEYADRDKYTKDEISALIDKGKERREESNKNKPGYYRRSYSYRRYSYGGGGGGSSYNPKIYSSSRSINGDRAATMGTRTPYTASTKSYLRPGFVTKGSREAYERQDI